MAVSSLERTFLGALRLARNLSRPQLSRLSNVGVRTIARYESGEMGRANLAILDRLAAVFRLPVQEVFPELFRGRPGARPGPRPVRDMEAEETEGGSDA